MTRLQWERLPESVRDAVREKCGTVGKAESATAGIMPGVAPKEIRRQVSGASGESV